MSRRNRVDPFGDLHAVPERGTFTGNRGCLVDDNGQIVRHHNGSLWITCVTSFRGWRSPLDQPRHWTPLFFLDDAVALAAGHRPCGLCRRDAYRSYQLALTTGLRAATPIPAVEQNRMLAKERLVKGRGIDRAGDRKTWTMDIIELPDGTVIVEVGAPLLVYGDGLWKFGFGGWRPSKPRPTSGKVTVLTPPASVTALRHGFVPELHHSLSEPS